MPMRPPVLQPVAELQIFSIFAYETADPVRDLFAGNYFGHCADQLRAGDVIEVRAATDSTPSYIDLVVTAVDADTVAVDDKRNHMARRPARRRAGPSAKPEGARRQAPLDDTPAAAAAHG